MPYPHPRQRFYAPFLVVPLAMCLLTLIETPFVLVGLAIFLVFGGILGWVNSFQESAPWLLRLGATLLLAAGIWFLVWYFFTGGRAVLRPILDLEGATRSIFDSLITPQP